MTRYGFRWRHIRCLPLLSTKVGLNYTECPFFGFPLWVCGGRCLKYAGVVRGSSVLFFPVAREFPWQYNRPYNTVVHPIFGTMTARGLALFSLSCCTMETAGLASGLQCSGFLLSGSTFLGFRSFAPCFLPEINKASLKRNLTLRWYGECDNCKKPAGFWNGYEGNYVRKLAHQLSRVSGEKHKDLWPVNSIFLTLLP